MRMRVLEAHTYSILQSPPAFVHLFCSHFSAFLSANRLASSKKDFAIGFWDAVPRLFTPPRTPEEKKMFITNGINIHFIDTGIVPLMVQVPLSVRLLLLGFLFGTSHHDGCRERGYQSDSSPTLPDGGFVVSTAALPNRVFA